MTDNLPLCPRTDIPRLLCGCPEHHNWAFDWDDLTDAERAYLDGNVTPDQPAPAKHHTIRRVDYGPAERMEWAASIPTVVVCDHGHSDDTFLCTDCAAELERQVGDVAALVEDLEVAFTKQVSFVQRGTPLEADPDEASLDWNDGAAKALKALTVAFGEDPARGSRLALKGWQNVLRRPDLPVWAGRVTSAVRLAHNVIERPAEIVHYGRCPKCDHDIDQERIWKHDKTTHVVCPAEDCTYSATLDDHQRETLKKGDDRMMTINELLIALSVGDQPVPRHTITNLIQRGGLPREKQARPWWKGGRLETKMVDVFRLGDARDAVLKVEIRQGRRSA